MIEVKNLHKSLGGQSVLTGVDLSIETGTIVSLLGGSGSGKSVLLRNIVGLMTPDSGSVLIDEKNIHNTSTRELNELRDQIGMLFQGGALFDSMTVYDNLAFPLREKTSLDPSEIDDRIFDHLKRVDMEGSEKKFPAELSGGMQKRVALARSLILQPSVIFFDEPTTGLDPLIANSILRLIKELHSEFNFTAIIVTHNFQKVFPIINRVAMLHDGKIVEYAEPDEFMDSDVKPVRRFIHEEMEGPMEVEKNG